MWDGRGMSLLESELWAYAGPLARAYCRKLNIPIDVRWVVLPGTPLGPFAAMGIGSTIEQQERACMLAVASCAIDRVQGQNKSLPPWLATIRADMAAMRVMEFPAVADAPPLTSGHLQAQPDRSDPLADDGQPQPRQQSAEHGQKRPRKLECSTGGEREGDDEDDWGPWKASWQATAALATTLVDSWDGNRGQSWSTDHSRACNTARRTPLRSHCSRRLPGELPLPWQTVLRTRAATGRTTDDR